jgi:hypothetical protein
VLAERREGVRSQAGGVEKLGFHMTMIARISAFGRSLLADQAGMSSVRLAVIIGLSSSAVLVLVRVGAAAATAGFGQ